MSGLSIFLVVPTDHHIVSLSNGSLDTRPSGQLENWTVRMLDDDQKYDLMDTNRLVYEAFANGLVEDYGPGVTKLAFTPASDSLDDDQPLSGHQIRQIVSRAKVIEDLLSNSVERIPLLVEEAFDELGLQRVSPEWRTKITSEIITRIENGEVDLSDLESPNGLKEEVEWRITQAIRNELGEFEDTHGLESYSNVCQGSGPCHDNIHSLMREKEFKQFVHIGELTPMDDRIFFPVPLDEKLHVSVPRDRLDDAYGAIAPILLRDDCPIRLWKVVDIEKAQQELTSIQHKLDRARKLPDTFVSFKQHQMDELEKQEKAALRLCERCQFTLYPMPGQKGEDFTKILREIERALKEAGVPSVSTPESDIPVGDFVSFRVGSRTCRPGDPDYNNMRFNEGVMPGRDVQVRIDPLEDGYQENIKPTFGTNPFYRALGNIREED